MKWVCLTLAVACCVWLGAGCVFNGDFAHDRQILQNWEDDMHYTQQDFDYIYTIGRRSRLHRYTD